MPCLLRNCRWCFLYLFFCLFCSLSALAQTKIAQNDILEITAHSDSLVKNWPAEKTYLQFDRQYYSVNDTMWFKAYLLNAASLVFSAKSGLLHIDISNDSGKVVKQYLFPLANGTTWGNITLDDKIFKTGSYVLHAYTNRMRNFGTEAIFSRNFYVIDASENNWLIMQKTRIANEGGKALVNEELQFNNLDKTTIGNKFLQLQVLSDKKSLYQQKIQTDGNGLMKINFALPEKSHGLVILAKEQQSGNKAIIPVVVNRPEETDVQFLPEGGSLVAGLPARVGFKAIGEDGRGAEISGVILDKEHQQVTSFKTFHNGMGSFYLNVQPGEIYTAKVTLPGGVAREYPLPIVKNSGTVLQLKNVIESDSVDVIIAATDDVVKSGNDLILIGKSRGLTCYAAILDFHNINNVRKRLSKHLFPSGITHFVLANSDVQTLNERLIYLDHHDNLEIKIANNDLNYTTRDSVALHLKVTDSKGEPVHGNFSLAVTDDSHEKTDSLNEVNIITRMLLTADLKGFVESPGYYFSKNNKDAWQALDNLMLTQGWVSYEPVIPGMPFEAEHEFTVKGKVTNVFSKPVAGSKVILFSKSPEMLMETITNKEGKFIFDGFPKVDTPVFIIKAVNKRGKSFNVGIQIDEPSLPVFNATKTPVTMPWYVNSDSTLTNYVNNKIAINRKQEYTPDGKHKLREVVISARKTIKDSQNLNGSGNADQVIDEKELEQTGKKTLLQLFEEKIKGFREGFYRTPISAPNDVKIFESQIRSGGASEWYFIQDKPVILIMDGTDIEDIYKPFTFNDFMDYLKSHSAEDIKGIEVNASTKYNGNYLKRGKWMTAPLELPAYRDFAFLEITTRSGNSAVIRNTPGLYLYKPLALSWPKQFYKPRYAIRDTVDHQPDLRSTIDWEPNIHTDKEGNTTVSFYAADTPSTYTVIIEGADFNGNIGFKRQKINIDKKAGAAKAK